MRSTGSTKTSVKTAPSDIDTIHGAGLSFTKSGTGSAKTSVKTAPSDVDTIHGAGLSFTKSGTGNPNPILHGGMGQAERAFSAASTFLSGIMAISASQLIGAPLKMFDPVFYDAYMAWTKESFAVLVTTVTQWWSPTIVRVSGDESMRGQIFQMEDGTLKCNFPHRLILMANHQLYTDWLYLWWIAYTNKMHGRIYIILKESLKKLPVFGWGAQFYNFIFLSRNWETDRLRFQRAFTHLKKPEDPMWLLIFPEGTNLSATTRSKSAAWAKKSGIPDMKHQLLPRTTGLRFCLKELKSSTNWLYDCTVAYEGVPKGMYGQDVFTLRSSFFEGRPPKSVNMFWRRFKISEIPVENEAVFTRWLTNRWREKDYILEYFYRFGSFPDMTPSDALNATRGKLSPKHAKIISTEVKGGGWEEFLKIFGPVTAAAEAFQNVDMTEPIDIDALLAKAKVSQKQRPSNNLPATSEEAIQKAISAANRKKPLPPPVYKKLLQDTPKTPAAMKKTLQNAKAQSQTGTTSTIASKQPRVPKTIPRKLTKELSTFSTASLKSSLRSANPEAMITRPLSTMAVQSAAKLPKHVTLPAPRAKSSKAASLGGVKVR